MGDPEPTDGAELVVGRLEAHSGDLDEAVDLVDFDDSSSASTCDQHLFPGGTGDADRLVDVEIFVVDSRIDDDRTALWAVVDRFLDGLERGPAYTAHIAVQWWRVVVIVRRGLAVGSTENQRER